MAAIGQGTGASGGDGQAQGEGQGSGDFSQIQGLLETQGQSLQEMQQLLQSQPWQQQQQQGREGEQETGNEPIDLSFLDDPTIDQSTASERLNQVLNGVVDARVQALQAPVVEQQTQMRRDLAARDLAGEFPELADEKMANLVAGQGGLAERAAAMLGQPQLAAEPSFWRLAYMAHKAAEAANQEGSGDPGAASLESGGGAGPAPMSQEDRVKQIMGAGGRGSSVLDRM